MENTNTQPQAFYTKMPSAGSTGNASGNVTENTPSPKKKKDYKGVFAVVGLLFFVAIASTSVFIAQKQVTPKGEEIKTVAPTAPESKPSATTDNNNYCATTFFVPKGNAVCDNKTALTNFTSNSGEVIPPGSTFNVGDSFVFQITVSTSDSTTGVVAVTDDLPVNLRFVEDPDNTSGIQVIENATDSTQTIFLNLGEMTKDDTVEVEFKVKVIADLGEATINFAEITTNNDTSASICSYELNVVEGDVECISKEMYNIDPADPDAQLVASGSALTRGEEYAYLITINATNKTNGEVKVHDIVPDGLEFVRALPGYEQYISNNAGDNTILANLGVLENEEVTLGFIIRVTDEIELGDFTNSALAYIYSTGSVENEPLEVGSSCELSHTILPNGTAQCIEKEAFTDFNGTEIASGADVDAGQEFVYKITTQSNSTTTGDVIVVDQLPIDLIFVEDDGNTEGIEYDLETRQVSMDYGVIEGGEEKIIEFKVQIIANPTRDTFDNVATVTTNETTSHECELSLSLRSKEKEEYACNGTCETNANCQEVNADYVCYTTDDDNVCRLDNNLSSTDCSPAGTPTPTPTPTPVATPAPGCNEICISNADCSNNSHVCVTTADGDNKCRLEDYPESETCTIPLAEVQPELPPILPETGPEDWLNWLKAGLVTLGVGTALFLLL